MAGRFIGKHRSNRREFMGIAGAGISGLIGGAWPQTARAAEGTDADRMAYRSFLDSGIPAAAGSDFSPGPFDPRMAIQGMVTRTGWDGKTWAPTSGSPSKRRCG